MNLSQVRKLKNGDKIKFKYILPPFTKDKEYEVYGGESGSIYVQDDNGIGHPLASNICLETHFEPTS